MIDQEIPDTRAREAEQRAHARARESLERQRAALALHELAELLEERQSTFPWAVKWCPTGDALAGFWLACRAPLPMLRVLRAVPTLPAAGAVRHLGRELAVAHATATLPFCQHCGPGHADGRKCLAGCIECRVVAAAIRKSTGRLTLGDVAQHARSGL